MTQHRQLAHVGSLNTPNVGGGYGDGAPGGGAPGHQPGA